MTLKSLAVWQFYQEVFKSLILRHPCYLAEISVQQRSSFMARRELSVWHGQWLKHSPPDLKMSADKWNWNISPGRFSKHFQGRFLNQSSVSSITSCAQVPGKGNAQCTPSGYDLPEFPSHSVWPRSWTSSASSPPDGWTSPTMFQVTACSCIFTFSRGSRCEGFRFPAAGFQCYVRNQLSHLILKSWDLCGQHLGNTSGCVWFSRIRVVRVPGSYIELATCLYILFRARVPCNSCRMRVSLFLPAGQ